MAPIRHLGVSSDELDELAREGQWRQWCAAEPVLNPLAAIAVTHQLGGSICTIARRFWRMTNEDIEEIVTASMWAEIRSFDWRKRGEPGDVGAAEFAVLALDEHVLGRDGELGEAGVPFRDGG
jgi:hypothetical protein